MKSARCVSLLHSLQFVRLEVSEQSLKIHIRKQQPPGRGCLCILWTNSFALLRKVIRLLKKQLVAANLTLTDSEATKFGPVRSIFRRTLTLRPAFGDWPALALFESLPRPLPLPLGSSRFGRHERLSRRSFMVGAAVFSFAVPSY